MGSWAISFSLGRRLGGDETPFFRPRPSRSVDWPVVGPAMIKRDPPEEVRGWPVRKVSTPCCIPDVMEKREGVAMVMGWNGRSPQFPGSIRVGPLVDSWGCFPGCIHDQIPVCRGARPGETEFFGGMEFSKNKRHPRRISSRTSDIPAGSRVPPQDAPCIQPRPQAPVIIDFDFAKCPFQKARPSLPEGWSVQAILISDRREETEGGKGVDPDLTWAR